MRKRNKEKGMQKTHNRCPFLSVTIEEREKERQFFCDLYKEVRERETFGPSPTLEKFPETDETYRRYIVLCKLRHWLEIVRQQNKKIKKEGR